MPCLAYLGPLTGRRSPVVGAGRRLLVCSLLVYSLLAARHSWPVSLARCSDEVGGFNGPKLVFWIDGLPTGGVWFDNTVRFPLRPL